VLFFSVSITTAEPAPSSAPIVPWFIFALLVPLVVAAGGGYLLIEPSAHLIPGVREELAELDDQSRRSGASRSRTILIVVAVSVAAGLLIALPIWAVVDADSVREGGAAGGRLTPWRALRVELDWGKDVSEAPLDNDCRFLRLLGSANGQIVLFDTRLDKIFRVPVGDASVLVVRECRRSGPLPPLPRQHPPLPRQQQRR
jgi:hypothetical protein